MNKDLIKFALKYFWIALLISFSTAKADEQPSSPKADVTKDVSESLRQAHRLYDEAEYEEALAIYTQFETTQSADLYYNLGNTYFRMQNKGKAMAAWLKAWVIKPRDPDIRGNIRHLLTRLPDKVMSEPSGFLGSVFNRVTERELFWLGISLLILAFCLGGVVLFKPHQTAKFSAWGLVITSCACFGLVRWNSVSFTVGAIEKDEVTLLSGPGEHNSKLYVLHAGAPVKILQSDSEWALVGFQNEDNELKKGWLRQMELAQF